jgi:hypothetical protein
VNQDNRVNHAKGRREGQKVVSCAVELLDHRPEPECHGDRTLFGVWQR